MIELHNFKGQLIGQIQKNLHGEDVRLLASNITKAEGATWQAAFRCRKSAPGIAKEYALFLGIFNASKDAQPYFIELDKDLLKKKLQAWLPASEALSILDSLDKESKE